MKTCLKSKHFKNRQHKRCATWEADDVSASPGRCQNKMAAAAILGSPTTCSLRTLFLYDTINSCQNDLFLKNIYKWSCKGIMIFNCCTIKKKYKRIIRRNRIGNRRSGNREHGRHIARTRDRIMRAHVISPTILRRQFAVYLKKKSFPLLIHTFESLANYSNKFNGSSGET